MFGPLSDTPDGTTPDTLATITCTSTGESPNKTHIFFLGVTDTHAFLIWLWAS